eukprot:CAMPEP_0175906954 /NCGR_PEP_ID=MMETSP0108-20121206/5812_1 /TAXON_ID=195067 ORGANISM="Goniomonas pacifica, Strain CCMP1869" /NCGR_SAMPLE_ID=MMETSP0108 /ASSEMBLY_ACC=CAM_ASM_000204 /LENGTH=2260 /DNA_ID=CAMNT_0017228921 /DNA_START=59 /DNA_END=6841 /DNA_ORIENTATION=-
MCFACGSGERLDANNNVCRNCQLYEILVNGVCSSCGLGEAADIVNDVCVPCPTDYAIAPQTGGACNKCPDGSVPNAQQTACVTCADIEKPIGSCDTCAAGWVPLEPSRLECVERCGDGIRTASEPCDTQGEVGCENVNGLCFISEGYQCTGALGSKSTCTTLCGDGIQVSPEACDDGNENNGDGCSSTCTVEAGYECTLLANKRSSCQERCGNGYKTANEACDDDNLQSGDGCSFSCTVEAGYTCTTSGGLSSCTATSCPSISTSAPLRVNGGLSATGKTGDSVSYSCDSTHTLSGASTVKCVGSGVGTSSWDKPTPTCVEKQCTDAPPAITFGEGEIQISSDGRTATYACNPGYYISHTNAATCAGECYGCLSNKYCLGGQQPPQNCPSGATSLPVSQHCTCPVGTYGGLLGSACLNCPTGSTSPQGSVTQSECFCVADYYGTNGGPSCTACGLHETTNGQTSQTACTCEAGFEVEGGACVPESCGSLNIANAAVSCFNADGFGNTAVGSICSATCDEGYSTSTTLTQCVFEGGAAKWTTPLPLCLEIPSTCDAFSVADGFVDCGTSVAPHAQSTQCSISCSDGYQESHDSVTCTADGWSATPTCNVLSCTDAAAFLASSPGGEQIDANLIPLQSSATAGVTVGLTCNSGYNKNGDGALACVGLGASADWQLANSQSFPGCDPVNECADPTKNACDKVNGRCRDRNPGYACECVEGYRLAPDNIVCVDDDECLVPESCVDGTCENTLGSFTCTCPANKPTLQATSNGFECVLLASDTCPAIADSQGTVSFPSPPVVGSTATLSCNTGYVCANGCTASCSGNPASWNRALECVDDNECNGSADCTGFHNCENTLGSFACTCNPGWEPSLGETECVPVQECLNPVVSQCDLSVGSCEEIDPPTGGGIGEGWRCSCDDELYELHENGFQCVPKCGNGIVQQGEACDFDSDGCSDQCTVEPGWTCEDRTSVEIDLHTAIHQDRRAGSPSYQEPRTYPEDATELRGTGGYEGDAISFLTSGTQIFYKFPLDMKTTYTMSFTARSVGYPCSPLYMAYHPDLSLGHTCTSHPHECIGGSCEGREEECAQQCDSDITGAWEDCKVVGRVDSCKKYYDSLSRVYSGYASYDQQDSFIGVYHVRFSGNGPRIVHYDEARLQLTLDEAVSGWYLWDVECPELPTCNPSLLDEYGDATNCYYLQSTLQSCNNRLHSGSRYSYCNGRDRTGRTLCYNGMVAFWRYLAFYYDGNVDHKADYVDTRQSAHGRYTSVLGRGGEGVGCYSNVVPGTGGRVLQLNWPLPGAVQDNLVLGQTRVRNHQSGGTYLYRIMSHARIPRAWKTFTGTIKGENQWRTGARIGRIMFLPNYRQRSWQWEFEVQSPVHLNVDGVTSFCYASRCGDGIVAGDEECDLGFDSQGNDLNGALTACQAVSCKRQAGFTCSIVAKKSVCTPLNCPALSDSHGSWSLTSASPVHSISVLTCNSGAHIEGSTATSAGATCVAYGDPLGSTHGVKWFNNLGRADGTPKCVTNSRAAVDDSAVAVQTATRQFSQAVTEVRRSVESVREESLVETDFSDPCDNSICSPHADCEPHAYGCVCNAGFVGDGWTCSSVVGHCADHDCGPNRLCVDASDGAVCECAPGYGGEDCALLDVDECSLGTHNCDQNAQCTNTDGSYECSCNHGFEASGAKCKDINECGFANGGCSEKCVNLPGTWECHNPFSKLQTIPCMGRGILTKFGCACSPGYSGNECKEQVVAQVAAVAAVTPYGRSVELDEDTVLEFPPNALGTSSAQISAAAFSLDPTDPLALADSDGSATSCGAKVVQCGPEGIVFDTPVLITLDFDSTAAKPWPCYQNPATGEWEPLPAEDVLEFAGSNRRRTAGRATVTFRVHHFSSYTTLDVPNAPTSYGTGALEEPTGDAESQSGSQQPAAETAKGTNLLASQPVIISLVVAGFFGLVVIIAGFVVSRKRRAVQCELATHGTKQVSEDFVVQVAPARQGESSVALFEPSPEQAEQAEEECVVDIAPLEAKSFVEERVPRSTRTSLHVDALPSSPAAPLTPDVASPVSLSGVAFESLHRPSTAPERQPPRVAAASAADGLGDMQPRRPNRPATAPARRPTTAMSSKDLSSTADELTTEALAHLQDTELAISREALIQQSQAVATKQAASVRRLLRAGQRTSVKVSQGEVADTVALSEAKIDHHEATIAAERSKQQAELQRRLAGVRIKRRNAPTAAATEVVVDEDEIQDIDAAIFETLAGLEEDGVVSRWRLE